MKAIKILITLCIFCFSVNAQMVKDNRRVADVYFQNKEYYAAAAYYKKALSISADSAGFIVPYGFEKKIKESTDNKKTDYDYLVFQLATSLRLYKNFQDAEKWYLIATNFSNPKYELSSYWYAECLRSNFKFDEAIAAFQAFISKHQAKDEYGVNASNHIESCKFALQEIKYPRLFKLRKLPSDINMAGSNYAATVGKKQLYFTSSRPVGNSNKNEILTGNNGSSTVVKKESPYLNAIYTTDIDSAERPSVRQVELLSNKMEAAAPSFHPNGSFMYFTAWNNDKNRRIYLSARSGDNTWSEPVLLGSEINVPGFNSMQPSISNGGKYLLFSSDRPGGSGKYDLWYAPLRPDGSTGNAVNMGNMINSKADEEAPYYNPVTKRLIFSSNGRIGMGGFDFYQSNGDFKNWTSPTNLGYPFNSPKDDLYFTPSERSDDDGYVSSDRESVCCLELFHIRREVILFKGKLIDCKTLTGVAGAKVTLTGKDLVSSTAVTDVDGNYSFEIASNRGFHINVTQQAYFAKNVDYTVDQLVAVDTLDGEICIDRIPDKPIVLKNILYEFDSDQLTEASKMNLEHLYNLMVENENIEIELSAHTDNIGNAAYNLDLSNRRAKSCVDYLIGRGIPANRMTSRGYGYTMPVAPNNFADGKDNPAGRALNRRTEFKVTKK
ncbi:OmpA family protein [Pedobacter sandarakinus]|uniref:OmpA family protein n=1 Tax=Pedobacter sandarakinus TaxID=353156 RepID=UPI00224543D9|nr:OmpA family protein [Pedobacter sandarakinus]MCX2575101.1 OmpA family protein [Pedobacter sandarakinus]